MGVIASASVSGVSSVTFTSNINNFNYYFQLYWDGLTSSSVSNASLIIQLSDDGGSTYKTSQYINGVSGITSGLYCSNLYDGTNGAYTTAGQIVLMNTQNGSSLVMASGTSTSCASVCLSEVTGGCYNNGSLVVNAIKISASDSSNLTGNFFLYAF